MTGPAILAALRQSAQETASISIRAHQAFRARGMPRSAARGSPALSQGQADGAVEPDRRKVEGIGIYAHSEGLARIVHVPRALKAGLRSFLALPRNPLARFAPQNSLATRLSPTTWPILRFHAPDALEELTVPRSPIGQEFMWRELLGFWPDSAIQWLVWAKGLRFHASRSFPFSWISGLKRASGAVSSATNRMSDADELSRCQPALLFN